MLRIRREWRQTDVAAKARISPAAIGRHENGIIGSPEALERHAGVFGLRVEIRLMGRSGQLVKLADEEHAAIVEYLAGWFRDAGFLVELEASFSEWGERGRIDLLAYDPATRTLVIVEVKTQVIDLQDTFGALNVKERLASAVAERRGWQTDRCVAALVLADTYQNRKVVRDHPSLFTDWPARRLARAALGVGERMLVWIPASVTSRNAWIASRERIRRTERRS